MTDIEMNLSHDSSNYNDSNMDAQDKDPLALDDEEKMDIDEPNTNPTKTTKDTIVKEIAIETNDKTIDKKEEDANVSKQTNGNTENSNSNENILKDSKTDLNLELSVENNRTEEITSDKILNSENDETVCIDQLNSNTVDKNDNTNEKSIGDVNSIDFVVNGVSKSECSETKTTPDRKLSSENREISEQSEKIKSECGNVTNSVDFVAPKVENKSDELTNGDCGKSEEAKGSPKSIDVVENIIKDDPASPDIPKVKDVVCESAMEKPNDEIKRDYTFDIVVEEIKIEQVINQAKEAKTQEESKSSSAVENSKVVNVEKPSIFKTAKKKPEIPVVEKPLTDSSMEAKDLENELPASIVSTGLKDLKNNSGSCANSNNLTKHSSGDSESSDEQALHIVEEDPVVNNVDKLYSSRKSKRKVRETEKTKRKENPSKKLCRELEETFEQHNAMLADYIANTNNSTIEEIEKHTETLEVEIETLKDLAQVKENEWNNVLHLKKVKEEILQRLIRRKKIILLEKVNHDVNECKKSLSNKLHPSLSSHKNVESTPEKQEENPFARIAKSPQSINLSKNSLNLNSSTLTMPITSSAAAFSSLSNYPLPLDKNIHYYGNKKIVPKPVNMMPTRNMFDRNGQLESFMMPMGRQGPTKDVQSIIADYRNRHPETAPRRGRRLRNIVNPQSPQMAMGPRPMTPHPADHPVDLGMFLGRMENNPNMSISEAMASPSNSLLQQIPTSLPNGMSFKDVLVQYANMGGVTSGPGGNNGLGSNLPPPPPYPEVTLHPVGNIKVTPIPQTQISLPTSQSQLSQQNNSLLHGILTKQNKQQQQQESRFSTFSPTLARLLTAPEKNAHTPSSSSGYPQQKNCMEITITPVPHSNQTTTSSKMDTDVVHLDDEYDPELEEDSAERPLVIDEEGAEKESGAVEVNESEVPECQGCHRKEAQFVCAGCANQWYCSRECQVAAWDEHSEMCSG